MVRWWNGRAWIERHGFRHISCITRPCSAIVSHDLAEIDPVLTADGHTFERAPIERWLREHSTSPLTNEELPSRVVVPNFMARSMIRQYVEAHPELQSLLAARGTSTRGS